MASNSVSITQFMNRQCDQDLLKMHMILLQYNMGQSERSAVDGIVMSKELQYCESSLHSAREQSALYEDLLHSYQNALRDRDEAVKQRNEASEKMLSACKKRNKSSKEVDDLKEELSDMQEELSDVRVERDKLRKELEKVRKESNEKNDALIATTGDLSQQLNKVTELFQKTKQALEERNEARKSLDKTIKERDEAVEKLNSLLKEDDTDDAKENDNVLPLQLECMDIIVTVRDICIQDHESGSKLTIPKGTFMSVLKFQDEDDIERVFVRMKLTSKWTDPLYFSDAFYCAVKRVSHFTKDLYQFIMDMFLEVHYYDPAALYIFKKACLSRTELINLEQKQELVCVIGMMIGGERIERNSIVRIHSVAHNVIKFAMVKDSLVKIVSSHPKDVEYAFARLDIGKTPFHEGVFALTNVLNIQKENMLQKTLSDVRKKKDTLELENRTLQSRLKLSHEEKNKIEKISKPASPDPMVSKLKSDIENLRSEMDFLTKQHSDEIMQSKARLRDMTATLQDERKVFQSKFDTMQSELQSQIRQMEEEHTLMQNSREEAIVDMERAKLNTLEVVIDLNKRKSEWNDAIHVLKVKTSELKTENEELQKTIHDLLAFDKTSASKKECVVCFDNELSHIFPVCNHFCLCAECAPKIDKCPVCQLSGKAERGFILSSDC